MPSDLLTVVALGLAALGLLGSVLPGLPGALLAWLGLLVYNLAGGLSTGRMILLTLATGLTLVALVANILGAQLGARRAGASWWSLLGGVLAIPVGFLIFALPGAIVVPALVVSGIELLRARRVAASVQAGLGFVVGWFLATAIELLIALALLMVLVGQILLR